MQSSLQSKYWCFTLNNYDEKEVQTLTDAALKADERSGDCSYIIFGREVGQERGTPHLQGYVEFTKKKRRLGVTRWPGLRRARVSIRRSTAHEASEYCKKEGSYTVGGTISEGQGSRTDLQDIKAMILNGSDDLEIANSNFSQWLYHRNSFNAYRLLVQERRNWVTKVYVLVGLPGTGKSRVCHASSRDLWVATDCSGSWFDGYQGQEDVLFDDFDGAGAVIGLFLKLCDRYSMQVPVKGGFVNWKPKRIFFTSNVQPELWFPTAKVEQFAAFRRRVTKLFLIDEPLEFDDEGNIPLFFE